MNYEELKKQATPTPWFHARYEPAIRSAGQLVDVGAVDDDGNTLLSNGSVIDLCGAMGGDNPVSDADMIVHCVNNFDKALEALKQAERHLLEAHAGLPALLLSQIINELEEVNQ
jgi:hypothetical protein